MRNALIALAILAATPAYADRAWQLKSFNETIVITTGNTYQAVSSGTQAMQSLTIQNNNTTPADNCWIDISGVVTAGMTTASSVTTNGQVTTTAEKASILLTPGTLYQRYWPGIPTGPITATCVTTGDSIYVDWQ
jgi:hypothetical protein